MSDAHLLPAGHDLSRLPGCRYAGILLWPAVVVHAFGLGAAQRSAGAQWAMRSKVALCRVSPERVSRQVCVVSWRKVHEHTAEIQHSILLAALLCVALIESFSHRRVLGPIISDLAITMMLLLVFLIVFHRRVNRLVAFIALAIAVASGLARYVQ